jgi:hypothetical protein
MKTFKSGLMVLWIGIVVIVSCGLAQTVSDYDALVQKGKAQLQAGTADLALASAEGAIKLNADRWEAYALAGGALMNLKRYEEAADRITKAIERAPDAKQTALRDLRRQCLLAESGLPPSPKESGPAAPTTQAEVVLWKTIENSSNPDDFRAYLRQFPNGTFTELAKDRLEKANRLQQEESARADAARQAGTTFYVYVFKYWHGSKAGGKLNVHPGGISYSAASDDAKTWSDRPFFAATCSDISGVRLIEHDTMVEVKYHGVQYVFFPEPRDSKNPYSLNEARVILRKILDTLKHECGWDGASVSQRELLFRGT